MSLMDVALGGASIADLAFGRFVQMPSWDEPVPADVEPVIVEEDTTTAVAVLVSVVQPKLQYASMRVHPTEEEANSRRSAIHSWVVA